jgi:hypothetical protein
VKEEMDSAAKAAQAEARSKSKSVGTRPAPKAEVAKPPAEAPKPAPQSLPEPPRAASLFDTAAGEAVSAADMDDEEEILAEAAEQDQFTGDEDVEDAA